MNDPRIVEVKWLDAWSSLEYYKPDADHSGLECSNIGYLGELGEDSLIMYSSYAECIASRRGVMVIPWEYVISIEELI